MKNTQTKNRKISNIITDPSRYMELGYKNLEKKLFDVAADYFKKAIDLNPKLAVAHNSLGLIQQSQGDVKAATASYLRAIKFDGAFRLPKKNLAMLLFETGETARAKKQMRKLLVEDPTDLDVLEILIKFAMFSGKLKEAAQLAEQNATVTRGYQNDLSQHDSIEQSVVSSYNVSVPRLRHDIAQLNYLKKRGLALHGLDQMIANYERVLKTVLPIGETERMPINSSQAKLIGKEYGKIMYRPRLPRLKQALSDNWDIASSTDADSSAEECYLNSSLGIVVIDNFLTEKALNNLRRFCLESTIWFQDRYSYGRLGAFFREGFNCPLLVQIGEEIKNAFPNIIGNKHALLQIWGFKFDHYQPPTAPHGDFAAVNVNFWITPDEANLDQNSGGMIIYDVEAPLSWDFNSYNNQGDKIISFLKRKKAKAVIIPYKANRAMIFNSDLFHATSPVNFKDDYESRRINITFLYGRREHQ